jgi:hypothetical protein
MRVTSKGVWVAGRYSCGQVFECESMSLWMSSGAICIGIWDAKLGRMDGEIVSKKDLAARVMVQGMPVG